MRKICFFFACLWMAAVISACEDKEIVTRGTITGNVADVQSDEGIEDAVVTLASVSPSVEMAEQTQQTDRYGKFSFENLQSGRYNLTVRADGYYPIAGEVLVLGSEEQIHCTLLQDSTAVVPPAASNVSVNVKRYFTLADGVYFYFELSAGVDYFYWDVWKKESAPVSEKKMLEALIKEGLKTDDSHLGGYTYNMSENTDYVYAIIAFDKNGRRGRELVTGNFTTPSSAGQPLAELNFESIKHDTVYLKVTRNNLCSTFYMQGFKNVSAEDMEKPDIYWASEIYDDILEGERKDLYTADWHGRWWGWPSNTDNLIYTLGITSNGRMSGVITKKVFRLPLNTTTNLKGEDVTIPLRRPAVTSKVEKRVNVSKEERLKMKAYRIKR